MTNETREQLIDKVGEVSNIARGVLDQKFKTVLEALVEENDDLDSTVRHLRRDLDDALARKRDVIVILGTLYWLEENIFDSSVLKEAVSGVFDQDLKSYRGLMARLGVLLSLTPDGKRGVSLEENRQPREPGKFCGVEEQKPVFWCPECNLGFRDIDDLNRHTKSKCKYKGEEAFYRKRADEEAAKANEDSSYCTICAYQAKNPNGLAAHKRGAAHQKAEKKSMRDAAKVHRKAKIKKTKKGKK